MDELLVSRTTHFHSLLGKKNLSIGAALLAKDSSLCVPPLPQSNQADFRPKPFLISESRSSLTALIIWGPAHSADIKPDSVESLALSAFTSRNGARYPTTLRETSPPVYQTRSDT